MPRSFATVALATAFLFETTAADKLIDTGDLNYVPTIYATLRSRAEWSTATGNYRFQVRTGRVGIQGDVTPAFSYRAELDLCDRGQVVVTDVWIRTNIARGFKVQAGQMRMPFSFGSAVAPANYLFANRPFLDKQIIGPRNVGVKLIYNCPATPLTLEAGVFNATSKGNHAVWQRELAYAAKTLYTCLNVTLITGFESLRPGETRINQANAGLRWNSGRWMAEGEYGYKHYTNKSFRNVHGYNLMVNYRIPLRWTDLNQMSLQARLDGLTDNWDGSGEAAFTDHGRNRLTLGATLSYKAGPVWADLKLNYEQYFMQHDVRQSANTGNMAVAELVLHF
ncbi:MAG: porin [Clostridium sp.]|nr:porin [Clostridium sp.]